MSVDKNVRKLAFSTIKQLINSLSESVDKQEKLELNEYQEYNKSPNHIIDQIKAVSSLL